MDLKFAASFISGLKSFSCLNPSSTVSIIKRVPSVCQSIFLRRSGVGGVMNSDMRAAASDTSSIGSFFIMDVIFFTRRNSITLCPAMQEPYDTGRPGKTTYKQPDPGRQADKCTERIWKYILIIAADGSILVNGNISISH